MNDQVAVRLISERVMMRTVTADAYTLVEMTLDEARLLRSNLELCIAALEAGESVMPDTLSFRATLPAPKLA